MSFLERLLAPIQPMAAAPYGSLDDFWYKDIGTQTLSGTRVDADTALKVSAFFAGIRLLSFTVGRLPIGVFAQNTRDKQTDHYAYRLLARKPNSWQTPFEFKQMMYSNVICWGNGYARKMPGTEPRIPVGELRPYHPNRVKPERLASGALVYKLDRDSGIPETVPQEEMLHWRSPFTDGVVGISLLTYARETLGQAIAQGSFASRMFSQGLLHKFAATSPAGTTISKPAAEQLKATIEAKSGLDEAHSVLVLPPGIELKQLSMSMADAQFLQSQEFTMMQLSQFLGIPPHMLELVSRSTSWGSGIESQTIGFNVYTMDPWLTHLEESIDRDLLDDGEEYYSKFNRHALLAADMAARANYYRSMTGIKAMTPNEVRDLEDMDAVDWGDEPLPSPNQSVPASQAASGSQARAIAEASAARLVRKEIARIGYLANRSGDDREAFNSAVTEFYAGHAADVAQTLAVDMAVAQEYCSRQRMAVTIGDPDIAATWKLDHVAYLVDLALEVTV